MNDYTTARKELNDLLFDWDTGRILYDREVKNEYGGWTSCGKPLYEISHTNQVLDRPFYAGYGGVEFPPILAYDKSHVYFIVCYDGASWLERLPLTWARATTLKGIPYFGGG